MHIEVIWRKRPWYSAFSFYCHNILFIIRSLYFVKFKQLDDELRTSVSLIQTQSFSNNEAFVRRLLQLMSLLYRCSRWFDFRYQEALLPKIPYRLSDEFYHQTFVCVYSPIFQLLYSYNFHIFWIELFIISFYILSASRILNLNHTRYNYNLVLSSYFNCFKKYLLFIVLSFIDVFEPDIS